MTDSKGITLSSTRLWSLCPWRSGRPCNDNYGCWQGLFRGRLRCILQTRVCCRRGGRLSDFFSVASGGLWVPCRARRFGNTVAHIPGEKTQVCLCSDLGSKLVRVWRRCWLVKVTRVGRRGLGTCWWQSWLGCRGSWWWYPKPKAPDLISSTLRLWPQILEFWLPDFTTTKGRK